MAEDEAEKTSKVGVGIGDDVEDDGDDDEDLEKLQAEIARMEA